MKKSMYQLVSMRFLVLALASLITLSLGSCKSQKKIAAQKAAQERAEKIEEARQDLLQIINDQGNIPVDEKEATVSKIKGWDLQDPEIDALISRAEEIIEAEKAEKKRLEEERRRQELEAQQQQEEQKFSKIENIFEGVANSRSMEMANTRINEALSYFASPDAPVLVIVFMDGQTKDYDRPTTIRRYLEYIKDQGKNPNMIHNVQFDANGKITELELIKK